MTKNRKNASMPDKPEPAAQMKHGSDKAPSLADELIQLNDDFAEFRDISAFMCHAFATALKENECINEEIISGARICSGWLQLRAGELKDGIRHVHTRYTAENKESSLSL